MTDDAALFAAALARPDQDTPRLVLADWFDDHGEAELAWALREYPLTMRFLADLARWDVLPTWELRPFHNGHARDRPEAIAWATLLLRYRRQFPKPPSAPGSFDPTSGGAASGRDHLSAGQFLWRWQDARRRQVSAMRENAARGVERGTFRQSGFPKGDSPKAVETRALLLHELVVRGATLDSESAAHWQALAARTHPLFRLPARVLPIEQCVRPYLTQYDRTDPGATAPVLDPPASLAHSGLVLNRVIGQVELEAESPAWAAVRAWRAQSNGQLEARAFALAGPFGASEEWVGWFETLPVLSVASTGVTRGSVGRISTERAYLDLFMAARSGGAYGSVGGHAYSRLYTWESFGWLAGAANSAPCHEVVESASRCRWFSYDTDWFNHIAWDLGLVCVRPDGMSVAVLAATDTD